MEPYDFYRSFNTYLRDTFNERVYRVPLDAGFTCPNRDGVRAFGGCTFCDDRGSGAPTIEQALNIKKQLETGIERVRKRFKATKFIAYFQAFTNTYAPEGVLRELYDAGLDHPDVVGLCIGTRPDCLNDNILDLLEEYHKKTFLFLEVGVQTIHNRTLDAINRGHSAEEFFDCVERVKARNMRIATHLIFGLPGESEADMMTTVKKIAPLKLDAIKIHQLCVYKGTPMEADYRRGELPLLEEADYVRLVADSLEMIPRETVVMRLMAEGKRDEIVAPEWAFEKERIMFRIEAEMLRRKSVQGCRYEEAQFLHNNAAPIVPA
ncbi:MAG: TIGR01212 family radical SAM protein [Cyanobacteria bacterium SZAS LIN-2]|nr:TIGR01212 family radical SAM protein [Cyanobacteria bacterium SZAS LIN-2]